MTTNVARRLRVRGAVQGVGFRPFVHTRAVGLGLAGSVSNDSEGVIIEAEGSPAAVAELERVVRDQPPPMAVVIQVKSQPIPATGRSGFTIVASRHGQVARTFTAPDMATCHDCLAELADPSDRRHRHPFISCTNCGPRFTIIDALPYDRHTTTMVDFPMCPACRLEYDDPANRRFHAQTVACHDCGPTLRYVQSGKPDALGEEALRKARSALQAGLVVAVKGIGGYHLACDASNERAVAILRERKRRGDKPFAVMAADLPTAHRLAHIDDTESATLLGSQRPILLLQRRPDAPVATAVAPGSPDLGLMLPYSPLHTLLFGLAGDAPGPQSLVLTSGNLGGEPIAYTDADALQRLTGLADAWLTHDRRIDVPCDDSVVRRVDAAEVAIRRSRGYAPLPVLLPHEIRPILATGGDLKNTCCLAEGDTAWLSQHIGDMDDLATIDAFGASIQHLELISGITPELIACDAHPDYRSSQWAHRHAAGRSVIQVQHHHAHLAAVMAEHQLDGTRPVIGFAFDGTGYGTDKAVWGGELLIADYAGFRRHRHLSYVGLAGGDASVLRPYRMALAHLRAAGIGWADDLPCVTACPSTERRVLAHQLASGLGVVPTSSMGRLFDAVAALAGVRQCVDFEAQAAMEFESLARGADVAAEPGRYRFSLDDPSTFDAAPLLGAVVSDLRAGVDRATISRRFHGGLADLVCELADEVRSQTGLDTVALSGGTFQNVVLLSASLRGLRSRGFTVLAPNRLPANDGGLALGQVMVASVVANTRKGAGIR